jgi:predicted phosphodiesterase
MLIAFLSDIHGNLPALEAAFSDANAHGVDQVVCAGDITGYGPF